MQIFIICSSLPVNSLHILNVSNFIDALMGSIPVIFSYAFHTVLTRVMQSRRIIPVSEVYENSLKW